MEPSPSNLKRDPLFYVRLAFHNEAFVFDIFCGCIVAGCFLLYLHYALTHTLVDADAWQKQYLVANHIVRFREFPSVGDEMSVFHSLRITSPVYYYLYGFVLWLHNSMLFARVAWVCLSMLAIVCVYLVAKDLFSPVVGLFACALFGFSFAYARPLVVVPNISAGQALLYLSFLLLVRAYIRKSFTLLLWAIAAYCVASAIYGGGFGVLPVFAVLAGLTLKSQRAPAKRYLGSSAVAGLILLAAYLPVFVHAYHAHASVVEPARFVHTPRAFVKNVLGHAIYATDSLFLVAARGPLLPPLSDYAALARRILFRGRTDPGEAAGIVLVSLASASVIAYFFLKTVSPERKRHAGILACGIGSVLLSAAVFNFLYHATWHYMASEGLLCMLVAETVHGVSTRLRTWRSIELAVSCSLIWCGAGGFAGISVLMDKSPGKSSSSANAAGAALVRETTALRQALAEPHLHPQIKSYEGEGEFSNGVPYLWTYIENAFNERFVEFSNSGSYYSVFYGYEPIGDDRYLFVVCPHESSPQECRDTFAMQFRQFFIVKDVIANDAYDIVLAKRF